MTVIAEVKCNKNEPQYFIFSKGAPEIIIEECCDKTNINKNIN